MILKEEERGKGKKKIKGLQCQTGPPLVTCATPTRRGRDNISNHMEKRVFLDARRCHTHCMEGL